MVTEFPGKQENKPQTNLKSLLVSCLLLSYWPKQNTRVSVGGDYPKLVTGKCEQIGALNARVHPPPGVETHREAMDDVSELAGQ